MGGGPLAPRTWGFPKEKGWRPRGVTGGGALTAQGFRGQSPLMVSFLSTFL